MRVRRLNIGKWVWMAAAAMFLLFYFLFDPVQTRFMPQCLFHKFTGLQCIGCGSQRVVHSLLHGDIEAAFRANALLVVGLPVILFLIWVEIRRKQNPRLYSIVHRQWVIITAAAILMIWLPVRNILGI